MAAHVPSASNSTVLDLAGERPRLLRPGGVPLEALEAILGPIERVTDGRGTPAAPGMLESHYAPSLPLRLEARDVGPDEALLAFGPNPPTGAAAAISLSAAGDLAEAAANLFAALRALDRPDFAAIAVMPIPERGLGLAINDRLRRAAAPRPSRGRDALAAPADGELDAECPGRNAAVNVAAEIGIEDTLDRIKEFVGEKGIIAERAAMEPYLQETRGIYHGAARLVVRPASTVEVAEIVRLCAAARIPIFPQGGNTGLCGGAVPDADGSGILLSLGRMNRVRAIDAVNFTITAEAGCVLAEVQSAAEKADRLFPLSLGAEGSCQIGGNLSTNAGGVAVLRYGTARELTLGLEVVLPDGQVWDGLKGLRKDNTGYDLKQLFIGGEGTLGIITAATLKLFPRPREVETAFLGLTRVEDAMALFARARSASGDQLTAFELIPRIGLEIAMAHVPGIHDPLATPHAWYALVEVSSSQRGSGLRNALEAFLAAALENRPRRGRHHRRQRGAGARSLAHPRGRRRGAEVPGRPPSSTTSPFPSAASPPSSPAPRPPSPSAFPAFGRSPSAMSATATSTTTSPSPSAPTPMPSSPAAARSAASSMTWPRASAARSAPSTASAF